MTIAVPRGANMKSSSWLRTLILLTCGTLVVSCSQAPQEPAPEFTLLLSQVTTAPRSQEEAAATASAPSQLRYIAVPPGQNVAGMARARIVLKQKAMRHRVGGAWPPAGTRCIYLEARLARLAAGESGSTGHGLPCSRNS